MAHEDAGNYAGKHPEGGHLDPALAAALRRLTQNDRITCAAAHQTAAAFAVPPSQVGKAVDLLETRIIECQLGLFGYPPDRRIVKPLEDVPEELRAHIKRHATDGRIGCASCWSIAATLGVERLTVSCACEALGIKVKRCQLGTF